MKGVNDMLEFKNTISAEEFYEYCGKQWNHSLP